MRSADLDAQMRRYEMAMDNPIPAGFQIVARLDGRGFTRLTKDLCRFEAPFDPRFRDLMTVACRRLMDCGFNVLLAYSESDEISLLFHPDEESFGRKPRKWISVLAGEASAAFSLALGQAASFDARLSVLPGRDQVIDYFRWRMADAARCCLNGHAHWLLRRQGLSARAASARLLGLGRGDKHELLFQAGINFDALPVWQKRGFGVYWADHPHAGRNPLTGTTTWTLRRALNVDLDLPWGADFDLALGRLWDGQPFANGDTTSVRMARGDEDGRPVAPGSPGADGREPVEVHGSGGTCPLACQMAETDRGMAMATAKAPEAGDPNKEGRLGIGGIPRDQKRRGDK